MRPSPSRAPSYVACRLECPRPLYPLAAFCRCSILAKSSRPLASLPLAAHVLASRRSRPCLSSLASLLPRSAPLSAPLPPPLSRPSRAMSSALTRRSAASSPSAGTVVQGLVAPALTVSAYCLVSHKQLRVDFLPDGPPIRAWPRLQPPAVHTFAMLSAARPPAVPAQIPYKFHPVTGILTVPRCPARPFAAQPWRRSPLSWASPRMRRRLYGPVRRRPSSSAASLRSLCPLVPQDGSRTALGRVLGRAPPSMSALRRTILVAQPARARAARQPGRGVRPAERRRTHLGGGAVR